MRISANTTLCSGGGGGGKCVLVPYREEHVNTYHCWMQDPDLREATASEPLSLDEEYAMQRAWRDDGDKLTFIVLDRRRQPDTPGTGCHGGAMAGDVNLFFIDDDDDEEEEEEEDGMDEDAGAARRANSPALPGEEEEEGERAGRQPKRRPKLKTAEIEVMIAEPESRRGGLATEALRLLMAYAVRRLDVGRFVAKIGAANEASLALFSGGDKESGKRGLGFVEIRRVAAFDEVHLALDVRPGTAARAELLEVLKLVEGRYDDDEEDDGGDGEGQAAAEVAAEHVLHMAPAGGAGAGALLPPAPATLLVRVGQEGEDQDDDDPDSLARRLAAVAGAGGGGA